MAAQVSKLSEAQWDEVRAAYEADGANIGRIAKTWGISRTLIQRLAQRSDRVKGEPLPPGMESLSTKGADVADDVASDDMGATVPDEKQQLKLLRIQRRDWRRIDRLIKEALEPMFDEGWRPPELEPKERDGKLITPLITDEIWVTYALKRARLVQTMVATVYQKHRGERETFCLDIKRYASAKLSTEVDDEGLTPERRALLDEIEAAAFAVTRRTIPNPTVTIDVASREVRL